ncbi:RNA polymerase sigma factor [Streptoalloteichus hindustanus]|uniref:RNA polymerase sigma factor, sigma-70 family n=1 Tax=Streptoalloteichus hindustanus TaxID=2017 RepID=A0A1M5CP97_STRHI|nr:sigma-70 family RNA polymerase sigma factor [Streptoalloteichus hindustanus]SHF56506.1 RNA polymerase sigma factor, sigma-70 family [Streptoalloteichus hindustanus]
MNAEDLGRLLRELAPQVLGALLRKYHDFDTCEDALQEAMLAAAVQWPADGAPEHPRGWLVTVASRRVVDQIRSERARRDREVTSANREPPDALVDPGPGERSPRDHDDTLTLLFLCCHPELTPASQVALTLRAVGGLTTAEVASAFLVPEATMAVRISRAKRRLRAAGTTWDTASDAASGTAADTTSGRPGGLASAERLGAVLHVLYLIFNEGYTASSGPDLHRPDLATEAIRLTRAIHRALPDDGEVAGLLALMLLTDARRAARADAEDGLVPLAEQDRTRWDSAMIEEGVRLVTDAMLRSPLGPYQLQAAIASLHTQAPRAEDTDWPQIRFLYRVLCRIAPNPMATLNHAIAVAMTDGPEAGLAMVSELSADERMAQHHRLTATRAHLLELAGDTTAAREHYLLAADRTASLPEQRYLRARADRLAAADPPS